MKARYEIKAAEWVRRVVLAVLLAVLLFAPGRCIYQNRTVAEMNEYVTAFTYKGESYRSVDPPYGYVLGTQIGKTQNGYRLFRAEGDAGEQFLIAEHIGREPIRYALQRRATRSGRRHCQLRDYRSKSNGGRTYPARRAGDHGSRAGRSGCL